MLNKLLIFSGLFCLSSFVAAQAQQLKTVAETDTYIEYELVNNDLSVLSPYEIDVPVRNGEPQFQILEQNVVTAIREIPENRRLVSALAEFDAPLIQSSPPAAFRGSLISSISINVVRAGDTQVKIIRYLKLRVEKEREEIYADKSFVTTFESSPLATGEWYKIPVDETAVYSISRQYLENLGIDVANINPRHIQIWATDGYPLAEENNLPRPVFKELPIIVQGESDNSFDETDRILFFANSPHRVIREENNFLHSLHPYTNERYIFLKVGDENGRRLQPVNTGLNADIQVTEFTDFIWNDEEIRKAEESLKSGRYWLGQQFQSGTNGNNINIFEFQVPGIAAGQEIQISGRFAARSTNTSFFDVFINGTEAATFSIPSISEYIASEGYAARSSSFSATVPISVQNNQISVDARYRHNESNSTGFIDWIRIQFQRELTANNGKLLFYPPASNTANEVASYQLNGFSQIPLVLDITDVTEPRLLNAIQNGNSYRLNYFTGNHLQIIAQDAFPEPQPGEAVPPTNLKGIDFYPDYIIVTTDAFQNQAQQLADYRRAELNPIVVTQEQIFNEFSGGAVDPVAIRDFVKYLYDRAIANGQPLPRYLLLFGDTTFDYKDVIGNGLTNHVVTYQSAESLHRANSYATDDFFGFLDDTEGNMGTGRTPNSDFLDIGIGRISAQTTAEANAAVEKIKIYENPENDGEWQNLFTFAADDDFPDVERNRDLHTLNADETANLMNVIEPGIRLNKVYELAYPEEITASGRTIPGATNDFINSINNGTLVINYSGHGNEQVLSDEHLFTSDHISVLTNRDKLSILVTATCQFGRYDDIAAQSGAEQLVFAENGGMVAALTTTRVVYTHSGISAGNNFGLNVALSQHMLENSPDGSPLRLGDIMMNTKNAQISGITVVAALNSKKFILIGDPALKFQLPEQRTALNSVNLQTELEEDSVITVRALDQVNLTARVVDQNSEVLNNFSGQATITVFDAPRSVSLPTDREWVNESRCYLSNRDNIEDCHYMIEKDVLFKGKATVQNGAFSTTFIVPKDISFSEKTGRIVFFAKDDGVTASGSFADIRFNGINPDAENDGSGPQMDVYLNDKRFVNGNLVNNTPNLIIELEDQSGINTTGTGVGHEIIATIDTKPEQTIVLNEYYEGDINNYMRGRIEYPLEGLPEGNYTLKVRAWDVHNNASEQEIFFEVASGEELTIRNVYNYPNPMSNTTRFTFEHNQPGIPLDVSVRIYTLSGRPVQHLQNELITTSSYASISWDGRDRDYDRLGNGTYIYVLRVTANTPKGRQTAEKIEKLVIIR